MKYVPQSVSRFTHRSMLKLNASSPTLLVVGGVIGFGVTTALAIKATRSVEPVLEDHRNQRKALETLDKTEAGRKEVVKLYSGTSMRLAKIYGPTIVVGSLSAAAVLSGHKILKGRHVATMMAYSGLAEQFAEYRERVAQTMGEDAEKEIYNGAHGEWVEDPNHPGESKREMVYKDSGSSYLRPWYDETNVNWTKDPTSNYLFLKGVQQHMNNVLQVRGHVFLNDVFDALNMERCSEGAISGWLLDGDGDGFIDFGFMSSLDPNTVAFLNGAEPRVRLNFNSEGLIYDRISPRTRRG